MNSYKKLLNSINTDHKIAEDVLFRAFTYREFKDNSLGFMEAHEYEGLSEGLRQYAVAKECYQQLYTRFGQATDYVLDTFNDVQGDS